MVRKIDYNEKAVRAAKMVLTELYRILGEYAECLYVVGGWVPLLTIPQDHTPHVGSTDVDLALNQNKLKEVGYNSIREILERNGYRPLTEFRYNKIVKVDGENIDVDVDLITGVYGDGDSIIIQEIQDISALKKPGCDLVFGTFDTLEIEHELPEGGITRATINVAGIVPFLVLKGFALDGRRKEKDAYDIYYCIRYYPGGLDKLLKKFEGQLDKDIVRRGLTKIADNFLTMEHLGPKMVVDFEDAIDEEAEILRRDVFELVNEFLDRLGITRSEPARQL